MKNQKVEVEGGEVAIKNSNGDIAIIPKEKKELIEQLIAQGLHEEVDALVSFLPKMKDYAAGGSLFEAETGEDPIKPGESKAAYWKRMENTYGSGVKHRQIYMDLWDKPIPATQIRDSYHIGNTTSNTKNNPELQSLKNQYESTFAEQQQARLNAENALNQQPDFSKPFDPKIQELNKLRAMTPREREANWQQFDKYYQNAVMPFYDKRQTLIDQFNNNPASRISVDNPETSWKEIINNNPDIEDRELLFASLMDEGADFFTNNNIGGERASYDGYHTFGLDSFGERFHEFEKKGYIPKDMRQRIKFKYAINEKGEERISADFTNLKDIIIAKNAFMKQGKSTVLAKAKELGITLSPQALDYFTVSSYNLGEGGARKMMESYHKAGILDENDTFLNDDAYPGYRANAQGISAHANAKRRVQATNMLRGEKTLKK